MPLSDQGGDLVMAEIEFQAKIASGEISSDGIEKSKANALLNHLTELHRLRDTELFCELCDIIHDTDILLFSPVFARLSEMQDE